MNTPKLSVLMSVYNGEEYLEESIQSILGQSFGDFEFIIVDDGSADKTYYILESYQKRDVRINILRNETNFGHARSLNMGIREARGEYIARQDSDDISMPDRLKEQLNFMEGNKDMALVGSFYTMINKKGKPLYNFRLPTDDMDIKRWLRTVNCFCHGSVMFCKKAIETMGFYSEEYRCSEDYALWLKMSEKYELANIPQFLYKLRSHESTISIKDKTKQWEELFRIKKDQGILTRAYSLSNRFIADEFFLYGKFFYVKGIKKLAVKSFIRGLLYRIYIPPIHFKKNRPMGICMLTGSFYPEVTGGGLQGRTLINALKDKGFSFFVLTTTRNLLLREKDSCLDIIRIYVGNMGFMARFRASLLFLRAFLKIRNKIDIVHLHGFSQKTILLIVLAKLFKKKVIQKMTSFGDDDPVSVSKRRFGGINRIFFSMADLYVSVNPSMSQISLNSGIPSGKLFTIPNGVDTKRFCPLQNISERDYLRDELDLPKGAILVLFVGFFSRDKGVDVLFEAFKNIIGEFRNKDIRLLLVGSTDTDYFEIRHELVEKITKEMKIYNIERKVIFVEKTLQIEKYYKASDIFVLPSYREGLPNVLLEAMSTAMPCIASDLKGVTDYLISHEKEGLIFKAGDTEALSDSLRRVLENRQLAEKIGSRARLKVMENFSIEDIAKRYCELYRHYTR